MKAIFRWAGILCGLILAAFLCFSLYSHYLVDYSLESLEFALTAADKKPKDTSRLSSRIYENIVQDLAVTEASKGNNNTQDLTMLELAARSFNEASERAGHERARFYLSQAASRKIPERNSMLVWMDHMYRWYRSTSFQFMQWGQYLQKQFSPLPQEPMNVSSYLILSQAEEKEKEWKLDEATDLYRKFLAFYPDHPEHTVVSISLSQALIKQRKYHEAERVLKGLSLSHVGMEEYQIVTALLKRVNEFKKRDAEIKVLKASIQGKPAGVERDELMLRLALMYLYSYGMNDAQKILTDLRDSTDQNIRLKAKFYLGWIYKLQSQYDQGAKVFMELTESKGSDENLNLGARAQLADIYYKKGERKDSYDQYQKLNFTSADETSKKASREAWAALADAEQANISYFDLKDAGQAKKHLQDLGQIMPNYGDLTDLKSAMETASEMDVGSVAFAELQSGRVLEALDLFKKKITQDPDGAWAYAGLADVYVLLSDLKLAEDFAVKAHSISADPFTSSVLGYVEAYRGRYDDAIKSYEAAVNLDKEYVPAKFNLAGLYLHTGDNEKALTTLGRLEEDFKNNNNPMKAKVLNNLGIAFWQAGRAKESADSFQQALDINPEFEDARSNLNYVMNQARSVDSAKTVNDA